MEAGVGVWRHGWKVGESLMSRWRVCGGLFCKRTCSTVVTLPDRAKRGMVAPREIWGSDRVGGEKQLGCGGHGWVKVRGFWCSNCPRSVTTVVGSSWSSWFKLVWTGIDKGWIRVMLHQTIATSTHNVHTLDTQCTYTGHTLHTPHSTYSTLHTPHSTYSVFSSEP